MPVKSSLSLHFSEESVNLVTEHFLCFFLFPHLLWAEITLLRGNPVNERKIAVILHYLVSLSAIVLVFLSP